MYYYYLYGALSIGVLSFVLAFFVYFKARKRKLANIFFLLTFSTGLWALFLFRFYLAKNYNEALLYGRLLHMPALYLPVLLFHFTLILENKEKRRQVIFPFYLGSTFIFFFSFTKLFIPSVRVHHFFPYFINLGPLYHVYLAMYLALVILSDAFLVKALQKTRGFKKNQVKYFLLASIFGFGGGGTTFFFAYGINIPPLGLFLMPFYGLSVAYAAFKYRLMDVRFFLRKGLLYSITTILLTAFFIGIILVFGRFFQYLSGINSLVFLLFLAFILSLVFQPLRNKLETLLDALFHRGRVDLYKSLRESTHTLTSILDFKELKEFILKTAKQSMGTKEAQLILFNSQGKSSEKNFHPREVVRVLNKRKKELLREDIFLFPREKRERIKKEFDFLKADIVFPLFYHQRLSGILCLGEKISGEIFSHEDIELLSIFTNQASIALENAYLFEQVREMKEYSESILRNMKSGVIGIDGEGKISNFNQRAEEITGFSRLEILGRKIDIFPQTLREILVKTLKEGKSYSGIEINLPKNGTKETVPIALSTSSFSQEGGNFRGVVAVLTDLSEIKTLENQIKYTERLAMIGTLAAGIAHEIKNPLVSIRTLAQLLPLRFKDREFREEFSSLALREIDRIDNLITKLLSFTHPQRKSHLPVTLTRILDEILESLKIQIQQNQVKIIKKYPEEELQVKGDGEDLRNAFLNLVTNSLYVMSGGGILRLRVEKISLSDSKWVRVEVADTGGGIKEEIMDKIFDPFFTTKPKGTGLGLFIAYRIIEDHGGRIEVKNRGKGAVFSVYLPYEEKNG